MLCCHEIVRIVSSNKQVSFIKRAELKMHLLMCAHCSAYDKHLKIMKESFIKFFKLNLRVEKDRVTKLEDQVIGKIKNILRNIRQEGGENHEDK